MKLIPLSYIYKICLLFVPLVYASLVHSVEVKDLYQAKIHVASQSIGDRGRALRSALQAVVVKVAGQESATKHALIKTELTNYNQYLTKYHYERNSEQLSIVASFDENKVNRLFQQAELPIWGSLRPNILLWIIQEQGLSRTILSESSPSPLPDIAHKFANQRGLPVIIPLMDFTDMTQLSTADLWGRFAGPIRESSTRYLAEAIVIIRVSNSSLMPPEQQTANCGLLCQNNDQVLDWSLITEQQQNSQSYQGSDSQELLEKALVDIIQNIYKGYALVSNTQQQVLIDVANIDSLEKHMALSVFLSKLTSVKSIQLVSAKGSNRRFNLSLLGSKKALLASLKLNKQLHQYVDPLAEIDFDAVPVFYWDKP